MLAWSLALLALTVPGAATARGEEAARAADGALQRALSACDMAGVPGVLDERFVWTDASGRRRDKNAVVQEACLRAPAPAENVSTRLYGSLALVTGVRTEPPVRVLRIWLNEGRGWRALAFQETKPSAPAAGARAAAPQTPPREDDAPFAAPGSPEAAVVAAFQAMEAAIVANDVEAWSPLVADEFLLIGQRYTGQPNTKAERIATLTKQKATGAKTTPARMQEMTVRVFGDAAVMTTQQAQASGGLSRGTRFWVKRDGRWQLVISQQTPVESP